MKKKYKGSKKPYGRLFWNGGTVGSASEYSSQFDNTLGLDTSDPAAYKGNIDSGVQQAGGKQGGGNFMANASNIVGFAGMFDSIAQGITTGIDSTRNTSGQPTQIVEGVLGGQSGSHLGNMWNTQAKTQEALDYIKSMGNATYDSNSTSGLLGQYNDLGYIQHSNINTKGKELEDFVFDPASYLLTSMFGKRKSAAERQEEINAAIDSANAKRTLAFENAINNFNADRKAHMLANYAAFGGPIFAEPSMSAAGYDIAKDDMYVKQLKAQGKNSTSFIPSLGNINTFDAGGLLSNNFRNGVTFIRNGGSHERNPYSGVPVGMAPDGMPNLVEEGEVIFNDYVFSNRLRVPEAIRHKYKLRGPKKMTFAEAFTNAQKESQERENDPISKNGLDSVFQALAAAQEEVKMRKMARRFNHMAANGGHLFSGEEKGSQKIRRYNLSNLFGDSSYTAASSAGYLPYQRNSRKAAEAMEVTPEFQAWTNYVLEHWNDSEIQSYLRELDKRGGNNKLFDKEGNLIAGAQDYFRRARTTGDIGYYHWTPDLLPEEEVAAAPAFGPTSPAVQSLLSNAYMNAVSAKPADKPVVEGREQKPVSEVEGNGWYGNFNPLRLADIAAGTGAVVGDIFGASNRYTPLDYVSDFQPIEFRPIGNYMSPVYTDTRYAANQQRQQAAATRNAIMQSTAPGRDNALLAADYAAQIANGELLRQGALQDYNIALQNAQFNRGTDQYNSEGMLKTDMANQEAKLKQNQLALQQGRINDERETLLSQARGQNLGNWAESISNLGRELQDREMLRWLVDKGVFGTVKASKGGKLKRKKKGLTY